MKVEGSVWIWRHLLLLLACASQSQAQTSALPQISTSASVSQGFTENLWKDVEQTTLRVDTKAPVISPVSTEAGPGTAAPASENPLVRATSLRTSTSPAPGHSFSSQAASSTPPGRTPSAPSSTEALLSLTTGSAPSSTEALLSMTTGSASTTVQQRSLSITGPTHREKPSQLNVGDEDFKGRGHRPSSLDPLLAGLLSVFIVTTAVIFVVLFLKFRQQNNNPEFHRLQDLPMDDLMEDTPLSRYTY